MPVLRERILQIVGAWYVVQALQIPCSAGSKLSAIGGLQRSRPGHRLGCKRASERIAALTLRGCPELAPERPGIRRVKAALVVV